MKTTKIDNRCQPCSETKATTSHPHGQDLPQLAPKLSFPGEQWHIVKSLPDVSRDIANRWSDLSPPQKSSFAATSQSTSVPDSATAARPNAPAKSGLLHEPTRTVKPRNAFMFFTKEKTATLREKYPCIRVGQVSMLNEYGNSSDRFHYSLDPYFRMRGIMHRALSGPVFKIWPDRTEKGMSAKGPMLRTSSHNHSSLYLIRVV